MADASSTILPLSARTSRAFNANAAALKEFLLSDLNFSKPDLVETLARGRRHFSACRGVIYENGGSFSEHYGEPMMRLPNGQSSSNLIWTFPGQGMQLNWDIIGQLKGIAVFRDRFNEILEGLRSRLGRRLFAEKISAFLPKTGNNGFASDRPNTIHDQALVFAVELSLSALWLSSGIRPIGLVGHSVGEIAAAVSAGVLALDEALDLVVARSVEMERVPEKGFMCQVDADAASLQTSLLKFGLEIACKNSPDRTVVAGPEAVSEIFERYCSENRLRHHRLNVANAFHSEIMAPASQALRDRGPVLAPKVPRIPIFLTCSAQTAEPFTLDYWATQMRCCVDFIAAVERVLNQIEAPLFLEVGIGQALSAFTRSIAGHSARADVGIVQGIGRPGNPTAEKVADLFAAGHAVPWHKLNNTERGSLVPMPTYRFSQHEIVSPRNPVAHGIDTLAEPPDKPVLSKVAQMLGVEASSLDPNGSLSDNGVDSLQLIELRLALEEISDAHIPLSLLLDGSCLEEIERQFVCMSGGKSPIRPAARVAPAPETLEQPRPKIFFVEGIFGHVGGEAGLRHSVKDSIDVIGLGAPEDCTSDDIVAVARQMADEVEQRQPSGPLKLVGHSFGAMLSYSLAVEFGRRGRQIEGIVAIDGLLAPSLSPRHITRLNDNDFHQLLHKSRASTSPMSPSDRAVTELKRVFDNNCRIAASAQSYAPINYHVTLVLPRQDNVTGITEEVFLQNLSAIQAATSVEDTPNFAVLYVDGDHFSMIRSPAIDDVGCLFLSHTAYPPDYRKHPVGDAE
ncbi:malonyl CoA-acyl carrier protein transacylase/thioesterase domain-containing protein/acyl carrier protein [Rhizobium mesoamericanum]|uniref:acyltransferase domain-containing protein n=1 Tax=Rhizobium mesoamericanum TaxID=1079800 RepID=UPI00277E8062|nr:acyltransferase domain-containing protein [Rhizobium mesoamericanum]MDQ0564441.1 malonyl CoA-acyl carrier protein transacylase/thioesterase domain-containing protein/acyl carrier protein [Rhizobium mesoamericanum]